MNYKKLGILVLGAGLLMAATTPFFINNGKLQSHLNMGGFKGTNSASPSLSGDLATKGYVDTTVGGAGTVTSVALTVPSWLTVAGSPVTSSGTLAVTAASGQTANTILATPDGMTGAASLRALVAADIPNLAASKITSGTLDAARIGTIQTTADGGSHSLKKKEYIVLTHPHSFEGTGAVPATTNTTPYFGQAVFAAAGGVATNYVEYTLTVPEDIDTGVNLKVERFKFRLGAADTGAHTYVLTMVSGADSSTYDSPTLGQTVNLTFAGDASGASGDVETISNVILTNWNSNVTAGQLWRIRLARDGSDASTAISFSGPLVISYGGTQ